MPVAIATRSSAIQSSQLACSCSVPCSANQRAARDDGHGKVKLSRVWTDLQM